MIKITNITEISEYFDIPKDAVNFLKNLSPNTENKKYEFGEFCFVNVQSVETKCTKTSMEAHNKNVDVQFLIDGEEKMYYTDKAKLTVKKPCSPTGDTTIYEFYEGADEICYKTGEAIILYPEDAHLPNCAPNEPRVIKKAVVKINVSTRKK